MDEKSDLIFGIVRVEDTVIGIPIHHLSEVCHVEDLSALPVKSDLLMGGFDLRENIIPVLNFQKLCGFSYPENAFKLMIVLKNEKRFLALGIDEVLGIAQTSPEEVQSLQDGDQSTKTHYSGIFKQDDKYISILNTDALFNLPDVYAVTRPQITDVQKKESKRVPMLVFEAGDALFSVPAVEVYAAVPRQEIRKTAITGGACLGEISYYNRRIPVVCPIDILGIGAAHKYAQSQIVVLTLPNDQLLGFAVDSVQTIEGFPESKPPRIPLWMKKDCFLNGVTTREDQRQVFGIDIKALHTSDLIKTMAALSDKSLNETKETAQTASDLNAKNVIHEREKYLVVKAGNEIAIPLEEVSYILEPPDSITPAPLQTYGFKGYFSRFGQSVALFDLCAITGYARKDVELSRILLTGKKDRQVAFCVETVIGIETSEWREAKVDDPNAAAVVKIASQESRSVLEYLSLHSVVSDHAAKAARAPEFTG